MSISKKYSIGILNSEKISEINRIIFKYSDSSSHSPANIFFEIKSVNQNDNLNDVTFFEMVCENETELDNKVKELIEELNKIDKDYTLRDEDTGELIGNVKYIGRLDIKFDRIDIIKKGTYKKIDELKNLKTEFGYCKGYKPIFRPIESTKIENINVMPESIFMFCKSQENLLKLNEYLSKKIMEIDPDFELELEIIKGHNYFYTE